MDYQEAIAYISDLQKQKGSNYSLEAVERLCELAGRPDRSLSVVHIAGTNGKGSVGTYLGNILAKSSYKVGRFISPAVFGYRERVQKLFCTETGITTEYISESEVAEILSVLRELAEKMAESGDETPTAFEMETVMAFVVMQRWQVDVALIECGMGGGRDATNIIESPILCVFSRIGLDHTAYLGENIREITGEKSGILKKGTTSVSAKQDREAEEILRERCEYLGVPLIIADSREAGEVQYVMGHTSFVFHDRVYEMRQSGTYQIENALLGIEAAEILRKQGYPGIKDEDVYWALANSRWPGRFECVSREPYVLVDGAHNPPAAMALRKSLEAYFPGERFTYIYGMFRDKDYAQIADILLPLAEHIYTLSTSGERALSAEELAQMIREEYGINDIVSTMEIPAMETEGNRECIPVQPCQSVAEALEMAVQKPERIVVFGSLSFLGKIYEYFGKTVV